MERPEQTYYHGDYPSLPDTGTPPEGYAWTNPRTVIDGTSWWLPPPVEPAPTCEHCKRCLELHGELIKLFREATEQLVNMEMRRKNASHY